MGNALDIDPSLVPFSLQGFSGRRGYPFCISPLFPLGMRRSVFERDSFSGVKRILRFFLFRILTWGEAFFFFLPFLTGGLGGLFWGSFRKL